MNSDSDCGRPAHGFEPLAAIVRLVDVVLLANAKADTTGRDVVPADFQSPILQTYAGGNEWADELVRQAAFIITVAPDNETAVRATMRLLSDAWSKELFAAALLVNLMAGELAELRGASLDDVLARPIAALTEDASE